MKKIWNIKIKSSTKKEFPGDPMMQELHELRARLAKKYRFLKKVKRLKEKVAV